MKVCCALDSGSYGVLAAFASEFSIIGKSVQFAIRPRCHVPYEFGTNALKVVGLRIGRANSVRDVVVIVVFKIHWPVILHPGYFTKWYTLHGTFYTSVRSIVNCSVVRMELFYKCGGRYNAK